MDATEGSPEHEITVAREALSQGDLSHAIHHVGNALSTDPLRTEWLALLEAVAARADDPLGLIPREESLSFVSAATLGYLHARRWEVAQACEAICRVAGVRPDIPYLAWVDGWLRNPQVLGRLTFEEVRESILLPLVEGLPRLDSPDDPARRTLDHAKNICRVLLPSHGSRGFLWYTASVVARRLREFDDAIALARQALAVEPCQLTAVAVASSLRESGRADEAVQAFRDAAIYSPNDESPYVDIGDILMQTGRLQGALESYEEALKRSPNHTWARAGAHACRYRILRSDADRLALVDLRSRHSDDTWLMELIDAAVPRVPYQNWLPPPTESTLGALRSVLDMLEEHPERAGGELNAEVTYPEAPSVLLAFRLAAAHYGTPPSIIIKPEQVPLPDPRYPKAQVPFSLWSYTDHQPHPNVPPPVPQLLESIARIAARPYELETWEPEATALATQLSQPGWAPQLVGCFIHPPAIPQGVDCFDWVRRVQIASALVLARLPDGYPALSTIAMGPVDWAVSAAVIALGRLACQQEGPRRSVIELFAWLRRSVPPDASACYAHPLACIWATIPGLEPALLADLADWRAALEAAAASSTD